VNVLLFVLFSRSGSNSDNGYLLVMEMHQYLQRSWNRKTSPNTPESALDFDPNSSKPSSSAPGVGSTIDTDIFTEDEKKEEEKNGESSSRGGTSEHAVRGYNNDVLLTFISKLDHPRTPELLDFLHELDVAAPRRRISRLEEKKRISAYNAKAHSMTTSKQ
jgi:hypothetical protein